VNRVENSEERHSSI